MHTYLNSSHSFTNNPSNIGYLITKIQANLTRNKVNTWLNKFNPYNPYMRMIFIYLFLIKWSEITTFLCSPCCSKQVWRWIISLLDLFRNSKPQNRDWLELSSVWQTCTIIYANPWGIFYYMPLFWVQKNKVHLKDFFF